MAASAAAGNATATEGTKKSFRLIAEPGRPTITLTAFDPPRPLVFVERLADIVQAL
jgi:hypothetical protein